MMRTGVVLFLLSLLHACTPPVREAPLVGSWTSVNSPRFARNAAEDRMTFYPNDSLVVETFLEGRLQDRYTLEYNWAPEQGVLTTHHDTRSYTARILELTNDRLVLESSINGNRTVGRYRRTGK